MNKQELFKQADYTFQRGNRELAKKYLAELLTVYPNDEPAWMLLARVVEEKERKVECYQRVLKLNPNHAEAKLALERVRTAINPNTRPHHALQPIKENSPYRTVLRSGLAALLIFLFFGTGTFVIARNNPNSQLAWALSGVTPTPVGGHTLADDVAPQTRAEVNAQYPQYAPLMDALLGFAIDNSENGMEGAPERPGDRILASDSTGLEAKSMLENSLPQPGSMTTLTITEQQLTSWIAMELKNNPDLPLNDIQVYLRDNKVQVWGMVNGSEGSTSALVVGELTIGDDNYPYFEIESMQIGQQVIPGIFVSQMEAWLNQALSEAINQQAPGLSLVSLKVTSGLITVSGTR